jgi:hypothetical protein
VIGGAHAGYNYQIEQWVLGAEGAVDITSLGRRFTLSVSGNGATDAEGNSLGGTLAGNVQSGIQGSIRARAGFAFDRLLIYGTGGVAFGEFSSQLNIWGEDASGLFYDDSPNRSTARAGWTAGGGRGRIDDSFKRSVPENPNEGILQEVGGGIAANFAGKIGKQGTLIALKEFADERFVSVEHNSLQRELATALGRLCVICGADFARLPLGLRRLTKVRRGALRPGAGPAGGWFSCDSGEGPRGSDATDARQRKRHGGNNCPSACQPANMT